MLTQRQKQIQENLRLFEIEKAERMESFTYRMKVYWYFLKKRMKTWILQK